MLRGSNWARWGVLVWMAYHVILSAFHTVTQFVFHSVLFGVITYFLMRSASSRYFGVAGPSRRKRRNSTARHKPDTVS